MQLTTNFKLKKIELTDSPPDITVLNFNWDTIDTNLKQALDRANDWNIFKTSGGTLFSSLSLNSENVNTDAIKTTKSNLVLRNATVGATLEAGEFRPTTGTSLDLGSSTVPWKDLYLSGYGSIKDKLANMDKSIGDASGKANDWNNFKTNGGTLFNSLTLQSVGVSGDEVKTTKSILRLRNSAKFLDFNGNNIIPGDGTLNLGTPTNPFLDLYISTVGSIKTKLTNLDGKDSSQDNNINDALAKANDWNNFKTRGGTLFGSLSFNSESTSIDSVKTTKATIGLRNATKTAYLTSTDFRPDVNAGLSLGTSTVQWSDLFINGHGSVKAKLSALDTKNSNQDNTINDALTKANAWNTFKSNGGEIAGNITSKPTGDGGFIAKNSKGQTVGLLVNTEGWGYLDSSKYGTNKHVILFDEKEFSPNQPQTTLGSSGRQWKDVFVQGIGSVKSTLDGKASKAQVLKNLNGWERDPDTGMVEMWGYVLGLSVAENTITLPIAMADNNYNVQVTEYGGADGNRSVRVKSVTNTKIVVVPTSVMSIFWRVKGWV